jgi:hypothetical protein
MVCHAGALRRLRSVVLVLLTIRTLCRNNNAGSLDTVKIAAAPKCSGADHMPCALRTPGGFVASTPVRPDGLDLSGWGAILAFPLEKLSKAVRALASESDPKLRWAGQRDTTAIQTCLGAP